MESVRFESLYPGNSREEEIKKILGYVRAGLSCQAIGVPGVGRANLLGLLAFNRNVRIKHLGERQKDFHFVYLNFAEAGQAGLHEVNKFIFLNLLESLGERKYQETLEKIQNLFKEALSLNDPLILWQNLKKAVDIIANQEGLSLVLLFDRFEEYFKNATSEFFLNLRTLRSLAKYRFAVIFSLTRPLEKSLDGWVYKEFYEFFVGHTVYIPLHDDPGMNFRLAYLEKTSGEKLETKIKESVLVLTGGHGKLTKVAIETLLRQKKVDNLSEFLLSQPPVQGALFEILSALTSQEQEVLTKIAQGQPVPEDETLSFLSDLDLIKKTGSKFLITIPLLANHFQNYIKPEEKIYFQVETNEILKGGEVISSGLSPQEFRLLKFLLQNPDRVCERGEIIDAVWPGTTNQGVSDEAIDQMIFRLRKKTEADPKNPQHLQTIKGRGFRFSP